MQKDQLNRFKKSQSLIAAIVLIAAFIGCEPAWAQGASGSTTLKGSASQSDIYSDRKPSLERNDINDSGDPFGSGGEETFDAPESSFQGQNAILGKPKPFNLMAGHQGNMGTPMQATPAMPPMQTQQAIMPPNQPPANQDPESVGQMKLAWDMWHKRVAQAIYVKYDKLVKMGFKRSRPLAARAVYTVTRDGRIINVKLVQRSNNLFFNTMIFGVLKSMNGSPILAFPQGSRRMVVEKTGRFLWNVNNVNGFRYTTGDNETIRRR